MFEIVGLWSTFGGIYFLKNEAYPFLIPSRPMSIDFDQFQKWFVTPMEKLRSDGHAGFIFAIIALPLLERFLREKSGIAEKTSIPTSSSFYVHLETYFPELAGRASEFWEVYRHALMHQATFKIEKRNANGAVLCLFPDAGLSSNDPRPIHFSPSANAYYMNPVAFYERVIDIIQNEFSVYLAPSSPGHPPPVLFDPAHYSSHVPPTGSVTHKKAISGSYRP